MRNKVGEALYLAIAPTHPTLAGKLTGMFLEATEVLSCDICTDARKNHPHKMLDVA